MKGIKRVSASEGNRIDNANALRKVSSVALSIIMIGLLLFVTAMMSNCSGATPVNLVESSLEAPMGASFCKGKLFVVESFAGRVKIFDKQGRLEKTIDGFQQPMDIACAGDTLFLSDFGADKIYRISSEGKRLASFGKKGSGPGQMRAPAGIAVHNGFVYVAEFYNHRIQKFSLDGKHAGFIGKKGHAKGELYYPTDIFIAKDGRQFIADAYNHRIQVFEANGKVGAIYSKKKYGLNVPSGIAVNSKGIYIADSSNHRVILIPSGGKARTIWQAPKSKSHSPTRLETDAEGRLIVIDTAGGRILAF